MRGVNALTALTHDDFDGSSGRSSRANSIVPRMKVEEGTVIIGGTQAGVMPCTAPSGWHLLGKTESRMFDPHRAQPCSLSPGDQVKFVVKRIEA